MEFLVEVVGECFFEGLLLATKSPRVPKLLRFLLHSLFSLFLVVVGSLVTVSAYSATGIVGATVCALITALFLGMWIFGCVKICRK